MAKKPKKTSQNQQRALLQIEPIYFSVFCVGKRLQQFDMLTNSCLGATFVNVGCPHIATAARYCLTKLAFEVNDLITLVSPSELIRCTVTSLIHEVRSAWEHRSRRGAEQADAAPLETRVRELLTSVISIVDGFEGSKIEEAKKWFNFGVLLVNGKNDAEDETNKWAWFYIDKLNVLSKELKVTPSDFITADETPGGWPVLPIELSEWDRFESVTDSISQRMKLDNDNVWIGPKSPTDWAKMFGIDSRTFTRWVENNTITAKKLTSKSYCIHINSLPKNIPHQ